MGDIVNLNAVRGIETIYKNKCETPCDINEHLPTLSKYAKECTTVCEMGVRSIVSTWAFLHGLTQNTAPNKKLICVDIEDIPKIHEVQSIAKAAAVDMSFIQGDSAKVDIPEVDMLFIDTFHVYAHLKRELAAHHSKVRKYIAMHDTEVDAIYGEALRMHMHINLDEMEKKTGYSKEEMSQGLRRALYEFLLQHHHEWKIVHDVRNNNGLTILERIRRI
jgi:hypothetical protein